MIARWPLCASLFLLCTCLVASSDASDPPREDFTLASITLELSAVAKVEGGFLVADDEQVGAVLFLDGKSLAAKQPHAKQAKFERGRKDTNERTPKLFPVQDFEGLATDGATTVYALGSHAGRVRGRRWERRTDREFLLRATWDAKQGELRVKGKGKANGCYVRLIDDLQRDHGDKVTRGLNAEGLALRDDELYVGLRSPLAGKHALVFHASVDAVFGKNEAHYKKLELNLGGGGVRSLHWDAPTESLLIASGPSNDGARAESALWSYAPKSKVLKRLASLAFRGGIAEGVCRYDADRLLVVFDAEGRKNAPLAFLPHPTTK